jgi:hypothetical protein
MPRNTHLVLRTSVIALIIFSVSTMTASAQAPCHNCRSAPTCNSPGGGLGQGLHGHGCYLCEGAGGGCCGCCCDMGYMMPIKRAEWYNWNRNYAHTEYGAPVALVVPPTAQLQTNYGWGVASSRISRIDHQFQRNYPGEGQFGGPYRSTPLWPSDTIQFGVYPVRGPW